MTKTIVTCDAAGFKMNLINTAVRLIIVFNPAFYPSILFGGYLGSVSGGGRPFFFSVPACCGTQSASPVHWAPDFLSPGLKCRCHEADREPPSVAVLLSSSHAYSSKGTVFIFTFYCHFFTGWRGIVELPLEGIR